jgi:hypothetical protein
MSRITMKLSCYRQEALKIVASVFSRHPLTLKYSRPGTPCNSPTLSARSVPDSVGGHCLSTHIGQQTSAKPRCLPLTLLPTDRSCHNHLFRLAIAGLDCQWPQRQTNGLELAADHETVDTPTWLQQGVFLSVLWTEHPKHQNIQLIR